MIWKPCIICNSIYKSAVTLLVTYVGSPFWYCTVTVLYGPVSQCKFIGHIRALKKKKKLIYTVSRPKRKNVTDMCISFRIETRPNFTLFRNSYTSKFPNYKSNEFNWIRNNDSNRKKANQIWIKFENKFEKIGIDFLKNTIK